MIGQSPMPGEIEQLGADSVPKKEELVSSLVSPSLSLAKLTAIKAQMSTDDQVMDPVHPQLRYAVSSADITSPEPHFIWSKEDLLKRSALFTITPGQMRALHEIMYPCWKWSAVNMSLLFHQPWVAYNHFIIVGNFLQFEIMEQNFTSPKPRYVYSRGIILNLPNGTLSGARERLELTR